MTLPFSPNNTLRYSESKFDRLSLSVSLPFLNQRPCQKDARFHCHSWILTSLSSRSTPWPTQTVIPCPSLTSASLCILSCYISLSRLLCHFPFPPNNTSSNSTSKSDCHVLLTTYHILYLDFSKDTKFNCRVLYFTCLFIYWHLLSLLSNLTVMGCQSLVLVSDTFPMSSHKFECQS